MSITTADDFVAELGRTVKLVVAKEVTPLREALAAAEAANAALVQRLEVAEAALASVQGRPEPIDETTVRNILLDELTVAAAEAAADSEPPDWREMVEEAVREACAPAVALLEALPPPLDVSGFATIAEVGAIRADLQGMVEAIPPPRDWSPEIEAVRAAIQPPPDVSGFMAKSEGEEIRGLMVRQTAEIRAEFHEAIKAIELKEGPEGKLPLARAWADDGVTYAGEVRTHAGSTWQAQRDTGKAPGGDDWLCLAGRGEDGAPAPRFRICGLFAESKEYTELDIVALNGASFVALRDDPGPCPGDGWQLWAKQGKQGEKIKGDPGPPGKSAARPVALTVDEEAASLTLALEDGTALIADLYPLLAQVAK